MNVVIVDDCASDCAILHGYIDAFFEHENPYGEYDVYEYSSAEEFLSKSNLDADAVFLDMFMGEMSGFDAAKKLRESGFHGALFFSTTSPDFAISGYSVAANGYLLKPFSYETFAQAFAACNVDSAFISVTVNRYDERVLLRDINYVAVEGHYIQIHLIGGNVLKSRMTFREASDVLLKYPRFISCYQGCIINMEHVEAIDGLDFVMKCNIHIPIRKRDLSRIRRYYSNFLFNRARRGL